MASSVLLATNDPFERDRLQSNLQELGMFVAVAADADQALAELGQRAFDVVIASMALEPFDGLQLCARVRERRLDQELVLIVDTAQSRASAVGAGMTDCMVRPVELGDLELAVSRCLQRVRLRAEQQRLADENLVLTQNRSLYERCLQLLSNIDLEWLQERVVQEVSSLTDSQSAGLWVLDERGELRLRAYRGITDKHSLGDAIQLTEELKASFASRAPWLAGEGRDQAIWVPLAVGDETVGLMQAWDPLSGAFRAEHLQAARLLGDFAAVGLKTGRKFIQLQRLGLRDRETAAYNLSYFTDYAGKEIYKARRYGRTFSLLIFSLDQLAQIRLRLGLDDARRATRGVIRAVAKIIRDSDVIAKASDHEFYLLLPETDFYGASIFLRRAAAAVRDEPEAKEVESKMSIGLVCGAATYPKDGEDFDELVLRCRIRADERRASLQSAMHLDGLAFWEQVELLLGNPASPPLPTDERALPSRRGQVSEQLFNELQSEIARELIRDPISRGLVYIGGPEVRSDSPIARGLENAPAEMGTRVYALGRRADLASHATLTPVFLEGDDRLFRHEFVLWLAENAAYALVQRPGRGATWGFHTADMGVVDHLVSKLQSEYDLQPF